MNLNNIMDFHAKQMEVITNSLQGKPCEVCGKKTTEKNKFTDDGEIGYEAPAHNECYEEVVEKNHD